MSQNTLNIELAIIATTIYLRTIPFAKMQTNIYLLTKFAS
ncbi:hypothetical protein XIS1_1340013 [Xenorhabdus innexi]|uniref:Uncharacterized protein n=1 Tax=Xenorhabdus innexi TaxID=290109 RepID=A0A1N6MTD1_9GAMM|nr:hypothetical protein XIS1_1340013 [Xenorhabdus innexi]